MPPLHADVEHLAALLGTWSGHGRGEYPTIESFDYLETVSFGHVGKPFLSYSQRTSHALEDRPLHAEVGYLRAVQPARVELIVAHPTGIVEIAEGDFDGFSMRLRSTVVARSGTAKDVTKIERDFVLDGETLSYAVRMTAVGQPLTHHLSAELHRVR